MKLLLLSILAVSFGAATPALARMSKTPDCRLMIPNDDTYATYADGLNVIEERIPFASTSASAVQSATIETAKAKVKVEVEKVGPGTAPVYELRVTVKRGDLSVHQKDGSLFNMFGQSVDSFRTVALAAAPAKEIQAHAGLTPMDDQFGRGLYYGVRCLNLR